MFKKVLLLGVILSLTQACSGAAEIETQQAQAKQVTSSLAGNNLKGVRDTSDDTYGVKVNLNNEELCSNISASPEGYSEEEKASCNQ